MKLKIGILLCCMMTVMVYGQKFAVSADRMNVAYVGVDNPLTIVAGGYSCKQLEVSCANGSLKKTEDCAYILKPDREGIIEISVSAKTTSGLKSIGTKKFRVKLIPSPVAMIAGKSSGLMTVIAFKVQRGVIVNYPGFDFDGQFKITSYKVEFFRNSQLLFSGLNNEPVFNTATRNAMNNLKPGDQVSITEIKAVGPDSRTRTLNEINLKLN